MVDNTEPVEQVAQVVEEKHGDIQPVEEIIEDTQPVEEMAQAVEPIPEHSKNGDSQSHAIPPQEQAAFTISQEGRLNISHQKKVHWLYVLRSFTGGAHCLFPIRSKMSSVEKYCS
ncbi:BnaC06g14390D [Brassica napus]|uniref:BnaC06g14390D protein n=1 Tax=Brassica napus TaxID=3708 RepID=A0A078FLY5_BRANA|nr:BnaC06g14390D [Brassica napus]